MYVFCWSREGLKHYSGHPEGPLCGAPSVWGPLAQTDVQEQFYAFLKLLVAVFFSYRKVLCDGMNDTRETV